MTGATDEVLAAGLGRFLSESLGSQVEVSNLEPTSAGARRANVLFDAAVDGEVQRMVATMTPVAAIQAKAASDEADAIRCAAAGGVPVAPVVAASDETNHVGAPLFVTRHMPGESVARRVLRLVRETGHGETVVAQIGEAFARLHAVPESGFPAHFAAQPEGPPIAAALANLDEQMRGALQPSPVMTLAVSWLERHRPTEVERSFIHGDLRNGNILVDASGLTAILDWEICRKGDPMEDLAWLCLRTWRFGQDDAEAGGLGSRDALVNAYAAAGGQFDLGRFHWWKVLGTLRWALGLAGQARAHLDGTYSNIVMCASGRRVGELEWDLLTLIKPR